MRAITTQSPPPRNGQIAASDGVPGDGLDSLRPAAREGPEAARFSVPSERPRGALTGGGGGDYAGGPKTADANVIAIVDYRAGNLTSVKLALDELGRDAIITSNPDDIAKAERIVFPGVGAAGAAMRHLTEMGLAEPLRQAIAAGTPFLGICLGMQILFERSAEDGGVECLGLLPGSVERFRPRDPRDKVPHMGWNLVRFARAHPVFAGLPPEGYFYFVHSYYVVPTRPEHALGRTDYAGVEFCSVAGAGSVIATQFHVEKSGPLGLRLLDAFTRWDGRGAEASPC